MADDEVDEIEEVESEEEDPRDKRIRELEEEREARKKKDEEDKDAELERLRSENASLKSKPTKKVAAPKTKTEKAAESGPPKSDPPAKKTRRVSRLFGDDDD
jgi:hypothetical protein